jgi:hypothetical protein
MTNHGASQALPPAVSVTESRKSFGGTMVLDGIDRPSPRAVSITMVMMPASCHFAGPKATPGQARLSSRFVQTNP